MNNQLTPKRILILSGLFLASCTMDIDPHTVNNCERSYYKCDVQYISNQPLTLTHRPYVVNNTPHIKKQYMTNQYNEKPTEIGLVDMNGRVL